MATITQQYSPSEMRQIREQQRISQLQTSSEIAPLSADASYEQQIAYNKQLLAKQKQQLSDFEKSLQPGRRTTGFTDRKQRLQQTQELEKAKAEIPKAEEQIKASEQDIAKFEQQVKELREAEAAAQFEKNAYDLAMRVFDSKSSGAIFSLSSHFNKDPWVNRAREIYRELKAQQRYQNQKSEMLKEIRLGNVPNVTISGSMIKDLTTNKPITITKVAEKYAQTQFQKMDAPGYYNPKTGELMSMKPEDAARLGFQKVTATGFKPSTGEYVIESPTGLLSPNQLAAYNLFKSQPNVAQFLAGTGTQVQSAALPTQFVVGGQQKELTADERLKASPFYRGPVTTFELASKRPEYSAKEQAMREYAADPMKFINEKGYGLDEQGNKVKMASGQVVPITAEDVVTAISIPKGIATFGAKKVGAYVLSEPATALANYVYDKSGSPKSWLGKFGKASVASYFITRSPTLSTAYGYSLLKAGIKNREKLFKILTTETKKLVTDPKTSITRAAKFVASPTGGELLGFAVGGQLLKRGVDRVEIKIRGVETKTIKLPGYGEVVSQRIPKYGDVIWIKGAFNASEKIAIMKQIKNLLGPGRRVFVQVSPQGIPMNIFSATKNLGFQVKQLQNPIRGFYQAPPSEFLKKYRSLVGSDTAALSYYAGNVPRDSLLPRPIQAIKSLLTKDTATNQRAFQYLEGTYKGVNTPKWIQSLTKSLLANKGIPKAYQKTIDKYFKSFMEKPIQFEGKTYTGLQKLNLVNAKNLRGMGSGDKLKVYAALLEYQNLNKLRLVSGAENLAGILPYGGEYQLVSGIGMKYFEKSLADLRKGVKPSPFSKLVEWVTGTKRGQTVARIDGRMVEIQPVRAFPGKVKKVKLPSVKAEEVFKLNELVSQASKKAKPVSVEPSWTGLISKELNRYNRPKNVAPYRPFIFKEPIRREVARVERSVRTARYFPPVRRETPRIERRTTIAREPKREMPRVDRLIIREPPRRELPRRPEKRFERPRKEPPRIEKLPEKILYPKITKDQRSRRTVVKKEIKKKKRYSLMPTLTNITSKQRRKTPIKLSALTGFEILRK